MIQNILWSKGPIQDEYSSFPTECIVNEQYKGKKLEMSHLINPYTKLDPTLPRIWNIRCPSPDCKTNHGDKAKEPAEIIYMKYDAEDLKFLYLCVECDTVWKTDN